MKKEFNDLTISFDIKKLDLDLIHNFLKSAYWSVNIPKDTVGNAIKNSICIGIFLGNKQIGFGRAITDFSTFAYIADIFILEEYRGNGFSKILVSKLLEKLNELNLRRILLATADAQGLYEKFGFYCIEKPKNFMEINNKDVYKP